MAKDLLDMDRLPTMEELKEFFKKNDWTSAKISDPAKRTDEERAEIAYVAKLMDEHFEKLAREKGRPSSSIVYSKDNPLIALQQNTEDLVASAVVKIANDEELTDAILSQFDFTDPNIDKKADDFLHNAVNTMLDVMEYDKLAAIIHEASSDEDFNTNLQTNFRYKDHIRRWEHTDAKTKVTLAANPGAGLKTATRSVEDEAIANVMMEKFTLSLDPTDRKIFNRMRLGYTQAEIAKELGYSGNSAISKRCSDIKKRYLEWAK